MGKLRKILNKISANKPQFWWDFRKNIEADKVKVLRHFE